MRVKHDIVEKTRIPYFRVAASVITGAILFFTGCLWAMDLSGMRSHLLGVFVVLVFGGLCNMIWSGYEKEKKEVVVHKVK